ncbi:flagellar hook-associated protein FlgK, partial [Methylobacterium hispanicum]
LLSGTLAANLELRDTILPQAQRQLDDLAAGLAGATTQTSVTATVAGGTATLDLSALKQPGDKITLQVSGPGGATRTVILIASASDDKPITNSALSNDATAFVQTFKIIPGAPPDATAINTALGALKVAATTAGYPAGTIPDLAAADATGKVVISGTTWGATGGGATVTVPQSPTDTTAYPQLAVFVDSDGNRLFTDSFDNGSQRTGFAQRLALNPSIKADTAALTTLGGGAAGADATRANFIYDAL